MQIDQSKIDAIQKSLGPAWQPINDTHTLTKVDLTNDASPTFIPTSGIPVKAFINTQTGEIRIFSILAIKQE
jgi:hypothetical protein